MNINTDAPGPILAAFGTHAYDPDATIDETGELHLDRTLTAQNIHDHATLVVDADWAQKTSRREHLSPTTTGKLDTDEDWGQWITQRNHLLHTADPISRRWLTSIFHIPANPTAPRAGWNHTEMIPANAGLNIIRRARQLADHLANRSIDSIADGLSGDMNIPLGNAQPTGGTWERRGQKDNPIDAVWAWLSLMGMTAIPATSTGTVCCVGSPFDGFIVLPLTEGRVSTIIEELVPQVDDALHAIGELAVFQHIPDMPMVRCWKVQATATGSTVTRRAVHAEWDDVVAFIQAQNPWNPDEHQRMTAGEFRAVRALLSVSAAEVADLLGKTERSVRRWEAGDTPVPGKVPAEMMGLVAVQGRLAARIAEASGGEPVELGAVPGVSAGTPHGMVMAALGQAVVTHGVQVRDVKTPPHPEV